jgi:hypothetical protein
VVRHFFENLGGVSFGACFVPHMLDFSFGTDPVGHAYDTEKRFSEETFHAARAIGFDDFEVRIGEQRKIQIVFGFEFRLRLNGVGAAAENHGVDLVEFFLGVTKLGRFIGSTGRTGLGKEIQNYVFAAEILERNFLSVVGRQTEVRCALAFFQRLAHVSFRLYF